MITEDYVSFAISKLLKEKGFDESCTHVCNIESGKILEASFYTCRYVYNSWLNKNEPRLIAVPTLQRAMKWLREVHHILLTIDYDYEFDSTPYYFRVYRLGENGKPEGVPVKGISFDQEGNRIEQIVGYRDYERSTGDYHSYEETTIEGMKYVLENLI